MKTGVNHWVLGAVSACLWAAVSTAAQPSATNGLRGPDVPYFDSTTNAPPLGKLEKSSRLIGMKVVGAWDKNLGTVKDLALDLPNGRVAAVIVATGGALGFDRRYTAVPPDRFTLPPKKKVLQINVGRDKFKAAPVFTLTDWNLKLQPENIAQAFDYFGSRPYFIMPGWTGRQPGLAPIRMGEVDRAGELLGREVRTLQDRGIGRVKDIMIDFPAGRVTEVVLDSGGFLGMGGELRALPPQSLRPGTNNLGTLVVNTSTDAFASAPHFTSFQWDKVNDWQHVKLVYDNYRVAPYFRTNESGGATQTAARRDVK